MSTCFIFFYITQVALTFMFVPDWPLGSNYSVSLWVLPLALQARAVFVPLRYFIGHVVNVFLKLHLLPCQACIWCTT